MTELYQTWCFYLPATALTFGYYLCWLAFGQDSVLPIDLRTQFRGKPLVGSGRGFWSIPMAIAASGVFAVLQGRGEEVLVLCIGAQMGCLTNSVFKRRLGVVRGKPFEPLDNLDFVLGSSLLYHIEYGISLSLFLQGLVLCGTAHYTAVRLIRGAPSRFEPRDGRLLS